MNSNLHRARKSRIAAIIPAYNEERGIGCVLDCLHQTDILDEIILVDDGSLDHTLDVLLRAADRDPRMHIIRHEKNHGKGQAIFDAWAATRAPYLLLLDADLVNLTPGHIRVLIAPLLAHQADMTLGLFWGGHVHTDLSHWLSPWLTGQRGMRTDILKYVSREAAAGYGFEVALTVAARQLGYRIRPIPLKGVWHPPSEFHRGWPYGIKWRIRMYSQILRALYLCTTERYPRVKAFFSYRRKG